VHSSRAEGSKKPTRFITNQDTSLMGELVYNRSLQRRKQIDLFDKMGQGTKIFLDCVHPIDCS
jgi:hypothetical protein